MGKIRKTVHSRPQSLKELQSSFDRICGTYDSSFLDTDPLQYAHRYSDPIDQEFVAFLSALLAFGGVKAIFRSIETLLVLFEKKPVQNLKLWSPSLESGIQKSYHRWLTGKDLVVLFSTLRDIYEEYGSLKVFFGHQQATSLEQRIESFSARLRERFNQRKKMTLGLKFLLPLPSQGSACKRTNLFLRWVVRKESPDLGIWDHIQPSELFLPLDTHLGRIVRYIGLTQRKSVNWPMVLEVSGKVRELMPEDPARIDFAITRLGILGICKHQYLKDVCENCPFFSHCSLAIKGSKRPHLTNLTR